MFRYPVPFRLIAVCASLFAGLVGSEPAFAADEEIQVYMDELNRPGSIGLDVHVNDVLAGDGAPDYVGAETALHRWRITPEFSLGLPGGFELGAYLPLATIAPDGAARVQGAKLRLKWLAPHRETGAFWGANFEIGRVAHRLDENPWNAEAKLIGGWRARRWVAAANLNFDFTVSGPVPEPASLQIAGKFGYSIGRGIMLGAESYNTLGAVRHLGRFGASEQASFLVLDTALGGFDINAGIGRGYGGNGDRTIVKFVIGVPLGGK